MTKAEGYVVAVFVAHVLVFFAIAIMPTGGEPPWFFDKFVRWCHVHLYHIRFLREVFQVDNVGPCPPALLFLSEAGRLEKFGLLPLLKKRLKRILIVDGSLIRSDEDYSKHLLSSLDQARKELHCEFVGKKSRDVIEEMRKKYVDVPRGHQQRHYRFKVRYYDKNPKGGYLEVSKGKIMIIAPRHPAYGVKPPPDMETTWDQYTSDTGEELDAREWGLGPVLRAEEVDRLTFCCCEACHSSSNVLRWISGKLCSGFPSTSTANQFFTPSLFTAYHREGYRACVQAGAEEFLTDRTALSSPVSVNLLVSARDGDENDRAAVNLGNV
ncbi:hypothetical protein ACROYT_G027747 [Oculina patagonica]